MLKQGEQRQLPPLQTRAKPPLQPLEMMYLGMQLDRFLSYAEQNNWQLLDFERNHLDETWQRWELLPGGEAVYTPPLPAVERVYARGFIVRAYFHHDRLMGLQLLPNLAEAHLNDVQLHHLVRAWFPDNQLVLRYQVLPEDRTHQVISAYWGEIPIVLVGDLAPLDTPFCESVLIPNTPQVLTVPAVGPPEHCMRPSVATGSPLKTIADVN